MAPLKSVRNNTLFYTSPCISDIASVKLLLRAFENRKPVSPSGSNSDTVIICLDKPIDHCNGFNPLWRQDWEILHSQWSVAMNYSRTASGVNLILCPAKVKQNQCFLVTMSHYIENSSSISYVNLFTVFTDLSGIKIAYIWISLIS